MPNQKRKKKAPTPTITPLKTPVKARFKDEHYLNWQKACHILLTGKPHIDKYVKKVIPLLHEDIRTSVKNSGTCVTCKSGNVAKIRDTQNIVKWKIFCPGGICQAWVNEISQRHANHNDDIFWKNSNICDLPSDHWELAKVFMGRLPISKQTNVEKQSKVETAAASLESEALTVYDKNDEEDIMPSVPAESIDISHVLSVLSNCKYFHEDTKDKHEKNNFQNTIRAKGLNAVKNVARIRNKLYHNAVLKINKPDIDECKAAMDLLLRQLRIYNPYYENEVKELVELDPVYMDRDHHDKFVRLEALTVAALLDDQENQEQENTENLDNVLKLLESEDNVDLRASVSMIRKIPVSIGLGDGTNTNEDPPEEPVEPIEQPDPSIIPEMEVKPEFNNCRSVTLQLPWEVLNRYGAEQPVLIRETRKHDEITVDPGNVITDNDIKMDTAFRYRLMIPSQNPNQCIKYGHWKDLDMSQNKPDIRRATNYLQWQAMCRIILHSTFTVSRNIKTQLSMMITEPQAYNTRHLQPAIIKLHAQKTELYTTKMLMVDDNYWKYIMDTVLNKEASNLQTKYNYVVYGDGSEATSGLTIPTLSKFSLLFKFKYVTETLFLADFLCHISREIDSTNDVSAKRENINSLFWMFRNNPNLQRDVDRQLRDHSFCLNGIIDLRAISSVKEIEDKWRTHVNKQRASVSTETLFSVSP